MLNVLELKVHGISKFTSACRRASRIERQRFAIRRNPGDELDEMRKNHRTREVRVIHF